MTEQLVERAMMALGSDLRFDDQQLLRSKMQFGNDFEKAKVCRWLVRQLKASGKQVLAAELEATLPPENSEETTVVYPKRRPSVIEATRMPTSMLQKSYVAVRSADELRDLTGRG